MISPLSVFLSDESVTNGNLTIEGSDVGTARHWKETEEVLIYLAECPEHGPEHRVFDEEDLLIAGGVHAIELELECGTDRFVRVGVIEAEKTVNGIVLKDEDLAGLPAPADHEWRIGRLSPAYGRSEFERLIYISELRAAQSLLASWEHEDDGDVIAFVPKKVGFGCLASMASSLCAVGEAFDTLRITVIKYWYDRDWKVKTASEDLILAEFPLVVPIRIRCGYGEHLVVSDVKPLYSC